MAFTKQAKIFTLIGIIIFLGLIIATLILTFNFHSQKKKYNEYPIYFMTYYWPVATCVSKTSFDDSNHEGKFCNLKCENITHKKITIHGLWPAYTDPLKSVSYCFSSNKDDIQIVEEFYDMNKMRLYFPGTFDIDQNLWKHEYKKRGICFSKRKRIDDSNYNYAHYFNKTLETYELYNLGNMVLEMYNISALREITDFYKIENDSYRYYLMEKNDFIKKVEEYSQRHFKYKINKKNFYIHCLDVNGSSHIEIEGEPTEVYLLSEIRIALQANLNIPLPVTANITFNDQSCGKHFLLPVLKEIYERYNCYVFSIMFNQGVCQHMEYAGYDNKTKQTCWNSIQIAKNSFTIHGLWPSYNSTWIPGWGNVLNDVEVNSATFKKGLKDDLDIYWTSYSGSNDRFYKHEYNKHGFIYNQKIGADTKDPEIYFQKTVDLFKDLELSSLIDGYFAFRNMTVLENKYYNITKSDFNNFFKEHYKRVTQRSSENMRTCYLCKKGFYCKNQTCAKNETIIMPFLTEIKWALDMDFNLYEHQYLNATDNCPEFFAIYYIKDKKE